MAIEHCQHASSEIYLSLEVDDMNKITIRITDELRDKLRWMCYKERRSQQVVLVEILEKAVADLEVPEEVKQ